MLRTILVLGRVSNLPTVWTNVLVVSGAWDGRLFWLLIGISLLYVAGMTLNDAFDAEWDRKYAPERPIPSGAISERAVWSMGFFQMVLGAGIVFSVSRESWPWLLGLIVAILLYDWLHKKTAWAVLLMGTCRALVYLLAASAIHSWVKPGAETLLWPVGMGIYVVGITLAARGERTGGAVRWFAGFLLAAPAVAAIAIGWSSVPFLCFVLWGLLVFGGRYWMESRTDFGLGDFVAWLIAAIAIFDALALLFFQLHPHGSVPFWTCLGCYLLTRVLQRYIPAT